jgi:hypothetical protein
MQDGLADFRLGRRHFDFGAGRKVELDLGGDRRLGRARRGLRHLAQPRDVGRIVGPAERRAEAADIGKGALVASRMRAICRRCSSLSRVSPHSSSA